MAGDALSSGKPRKSFSSLIYDPQARGIFYQVVTVASVALFVWIITQNTIHNLEKANIASGFGFLQGRAGFDIGQQAIEYNSDSTYGRALLVGLLNTLQVAFFGIITATILGFLVGIARLSHNWLLAKLAQAYVEIFRNIPPFWSFSSGTRGLSQSFRRRVIPLRCHSAASSTIVACSSRRQSGAKAHG